MQLNNFRSLGWACAALLGGFIVVSGFQDANQKIGVVDLATVVEQSNFGKQNQTAFTQMKSSREGVLEFVDTYRVLTAEQATRFKDLSIKASITEAEKAELERIKADVIAADKKSKELNTKQNLTPEERTLMQEYANRSQGLELTAQRWYREFTTELQQWTEKQKIDSITKARDAVREVARTQGYSVVFESSVAPYGANDLSDAALKAMNAKG